MHKSKNTFSEMFLSSVVISSLFVGRIQQIQLLGRDMRGSMHDKLWNQIEAEIHLHRHKTVIRACRGRKDPHNKPPKPPPPPAPSEDINDDDLDSVNRKRRGIGEPRTIVIHKDKSEGLGISITVSYLVCQMIKSFIGVLHSGFHLIWK